eukprot:m.41672 g.41672  ORF g.41672 m.41672 type:complete len:93 (+) comp8243_c0_seq1:474-752(+)
MCSLHAFCPSSGFVFTARSIDRYKPNTCFWMPENRIRRLIPLSAAVAQANTVGRADCRPTTVNAAAISPIGSLFHIDYFDIIVVFSVIISCH